MENKNISRDKIISMLEVGAPWSAISDMLVRFGSSTEDVAKIQSDLDSYALKPGREPTTPTTIKP